MFKSRVHFKYSLRNDFTCYLGESLSVFLFAVLNDLEETYGIKWF